MTMPKAYSGDLRVRVIEMVEAGASRREAAEVFALADSTAVKWLQRWEESGSAAAKPRGGSISPLEPHATLILEVVQAQPDATFVELLVVLKGRGIRTSRSALWRFFGRHNITFKKKSLSASERQRQDVARARRKWIREQGLLDPARLVFIDETSVNTQMVRLYGHGPRGVRLVDHVPFGDRKTLTYVAALRHDRMVAPLVIDGPMTGDIFLAYIEQCVVPILKHDDIVVLDNLPAHKVSGIAEAISAAGATLRYLPQYSPDLNPIELPFSKFKAFLRKLAERTIPGLHGAIRSFLHTLKPQECANCYKHAGYAAI
jgi:transposase